MEGQRILVDWGVKGARSSKKSDTLKKVTELVRLYHPHIIVVENCRTAGSRRCGRVRHLLDRVHIIADKEGIKTRQVTPAAVQKVFLAFRAKTKHQIAQEIARQLPELAPRLPRYRKPWMSEDYRMAIFDAAAFALTYFYSRPMRSQIG
jgi:hypothetical protein